MFRLYLHSFDKQVVYYDFDSYDKALQHGAYVIKNSNYPVVRFNIEEI